MCDVVYAIHARRVEEMTLAAITAGAGGSVQEALDEFDTALNAEPPKVTTQYARLRRALGV